VDTPDLISALRALPEVDLDADATRRLRARLVTRLGRERAKRKARHASFLRATVLATTCLLYLAWAIVFTR
jgi:hypothetical protein